MPFNQLVKTFPRDVAHIAVDDSGSYYLAFDRNGTLYGTYPVGVESNNLERHSAARWHSLLSMKQKPVSDFHLSTCCTMLIDPNPVPGWSTIEKQANDNWGSGYDIWDQPFGSEISEDFVVMI